MSLTYYIVENWCASCGRRDLREIARSSAGHRLFARAESYADWVRELSAADRIEDESGNPTNAPSLIGLAATKMCDTIESEGRPDHDVWLLPARYWQDHSDVSAGKPTGLLTEDERELMRDLQDEMAVLVARAAVRLVLHRELKKMGGVKS